MRLLLLPVITLAFVASAQARPYLGVDAFLWTYDEDFVEEAQATGIRFRGGYEATPHLALEVQFATGGEDTVLVSVPGAGSAYVDVELDSLLSFMVKPQLPLAERVKLFGLIGATRAELTATGPGGSFTDDDTGLSFGLGAEIGVTDRLWLGGDAVSYLRDDAYDATAVSLGVRIAF